MPYGRVRPPPLVTPSGPVGNAGKDRFGRESPPFRPSRSPGPAAHGTPDVRMRRSTDHLARHLENQIERREDLLDEQTSRIEKL